MPVRQVQQIGHNIIGGVPSRKLGRMVHFESLIEERYIRLIEYAPEVVWYEEQPCTIRYRANHHDHPYTPDVLVRWRSGTTTLVECKPQHQVSDPKNALKWTAARLWCAAQQWTFVVVTDATLLPFAPLLDNLRLLLSHAHHPVPPEVREIVLRVMHDIGGQCSIATLMEHCPQLDPLLDRTHVLALLYDGILSADLTQPLHLAETIIAWKGAADAPTRCL
ncbi:MAG: TnsA endonuclease N-terminal domain-containing protein [Ktedonobacterales bacterium]|nr:TnsA endonuclease N-terminal domain-containing protein [Ktedonobacterales bacterium]